MGNWMNAAVLICLSIPLIFKWEIFHQVLDEQQSRNLQVQISAVLACISPLFVELVLFSSLGLVSSLRMPETEDSFCLVLRSNISIVGLCNSIYRWYLFWFIDYCRNEPFILLDFLARLSEFLCVFRQAFCSSSRWILILSQDGMLIFLLKGVLFRNSNFLRYIISLCFLTPNPKCIFRNFTRTSKPIIDVRK